MAKSPWENLTAIIAKCWRMALLASCIRSLIALYLDSTAVSQKMEMMSCFLVTETHALIATGIYACKIVFVTGRRFLGDCAQVRCGLKCDPPVGDTLTPRTQGLHGLFESAVGSEQASFLPGEEGSSVMNDVSQRPFECVPVSDLVIVFERLGTHSVFGFHIL